MKFDTCAIRKEEHKGKAQIQIAFDEDHNLPEYKPDISGVILSKGSVSVEEVKTTKGQVTVKGMIKCQVLYRAKESNTGFGSISKTFPFQETIALDAAREFDTALVTCQVEDLRVHITNSRKLEFEGSVQMEVSVSEFVTVNVPCSCEQRQGLEIKTGKLEYLQLTDSGRDQLRIHEELELPANKLNVQEILWTDVKLEAVQWKPVDGGMELLGDLKVFCLYQGEPGLRLEWYENRIPLFGRLDIDGAGPEKICHVKITGEEWKLLVQEDLDGEQRLLAVDGTVKCEYRVYREEETEVIEDLYGLNATFVPEFSPVTVDHLLIKNDSRCKISDVLMLKSGAKEVLQVLHCDGEIRVDHREVVEDGILIKGAILIQVLYLTRDDQFPMEQFQGSVPFCYQVEVPGISAGLRSEWDRRMNHLSVMMRNSTMLEVQAMIDLPVLVFSEDHMDNMISVKEEPLEAAILMEIPAITGIRTKEGDSLWSIAKQHHTTCELIRQNNPALEEPLRAGTELLLVKQTETFVQT